MPEEYPKWLYHRTEKPCIVQDPDEHAALGEGWAETPSVDVQPDETVQDPDEHAAPKKRGRK